MNDVGKSRAYDWRVLCRVCKNDLGKAPKRGKVIDRNARGMNYFVMDIDACEKGAAERN